MNLKKKLVITGLVLIAVVLSGTLITVALLQNNTQPDDENQTDDANTIVGMGTIEFIDLEGGFYGIISDDDQHYLPVDLPEEYQQDGLRISFTLEESEDAFSIFMWGILVEIVDIAILE